MDAAYFKAAIPEPYVIFGVRLLPFSLGRYQLLKRFECAFVSEVEAKASFGDLILGLLVCAMSVREFLALIEKGKLFKTAKKLSKRIRREMRHDKHFSILEKYGLFQAYITEAQQVPKYWEEQDGNPGSGAHWSQSVEVTLRSDLGYSLEEIEEAPLSKCLADYFKHAENQGAIRLITDEELAQAEANEKIFQALSKGGSWG